MITNLDDAIKYFEENKNQKGIFLPNIAPETKIKITTTHSVYDLIYLGENKANITGGTMSDGRPRYPNPEPILILGSSWGGMMTKTDWIMYQLRLSFIELNKNLVTITSNVLEVEMESFDGSWKHETSWQKDQPISQ